MVIGCGITFQAREVQVPSGYSEIPRIDHINKGDYNG